MGLRVFVDYNTEYDSNVRIDINTVVQKYLLEFLRPRLPLVLFDDESLEVDPVAAFDSEHQCWYGIPDWSTRRDLPQLTKEEMKHVTDLWSR